MEAGEITNRLRRVEGQVRGLQRMIEEQRDCEAILTQLMAVRAALDRVGLLIADSFVHDCVLTTDGELARERMGRVLELVFSRFSLPMAAADIPEGDLLPVQENPNHDQAD
jgi:DNA-binding FrmR family transcriptional regulator